MNTAGGPKQDHAQDHPGAPSGDPTREQPVAPVVDLEAEPTGRPIRFAESFKAVFWSFFGVRKRRDLERDVARLNPIHVVIAAFLMMGAFIALLITVVHFVTAK